MFRSISSKEIIAVLLLIIVAFIPRFVQLGYSDFYGDETKALYYNKSIGLQDFLFSQRKGPVQFLVSWSMENITGGFDEFYMRLPFAIAGFLSVFVLYLIVRRLFNWKIAAVAAFLFALNGFSIGFSRSVQYQSFLFLFGFLSILFTLYYLDELRRNVQKFYLVLVGVLLAFAYLAHWDAIYYDLAVGLLLLQKFKDKQVLKDVLYFLLVPFLIIVCAYFIPYFWVGDKGETLFSYINNRRLGLKVLPHSSLYTYLIYNPTFYSLIPFVFALLPLKKSFATPFRQSIKFIYLWFLLPFVVLEVIFSNPGTHIFNYIIPLLILSAVGIVEGFGHVKNSFKKYYFGHVGVLFISLLAIQTFIFIPVFNTRYPWQPTEIGPLTLNRIEKNKFQLFLYGFPYYRGWDQIKEHTATLELAEPNTFFTNDNLTIGEFYMFPIPQSASRPEVYVEVINNQEFALPEDMITNDKVKYYAKKDIIVDGVVVARVYDRD